MDLQGATENISPIVGGYFCVTIGSGTATVGGCGVQLGPLPRCLGFGGELRTWREFLQNMYGFRCNCPMCVANQQWMLQAGKFSGLSVLRAYVG